MQNFPLRRLTTTLAISASLATGCASASQTSADSDGTYSGKRVVYSGAQNSAAYLAISCGIRGRGRELGVTVDIQSPPQFTAASQLPMINAAVTGNPDGLVVSPADAQALAAPLSIAHARGIPVVTALNTLTDPRPLAGQVLADESAGGRRAAELVAARLRGKPGKVAVLTYTPGKSVPADTRWRAFEDAIKSIGSITYLGTQIVGINPAESAAKMNALLASDPDISAVVTTFGRAGEGAATALRQRGLHDTYLVAFDTYAGVVQDLQRGEIGALIDYNLPQLGRVALDAVLAVATGNNPPEVTALPPITYTADNINDPNLRSTLQSTPCSA